MEFKIELAKPEDAAAIQRVKDLSWQATYPNAELGITKEDIIGRNIQSRESIKRTAERIAAGGKFWIAKVNGEVVGMSSPYVDEQKRNRVGAIYILPEFHGQGIGTALMQNVFEFFPKDEPIYLECATYNTKAFNFYRKMGFEVDENVPIGKVEIAGGEKSIPVRTMFRKR